MLYSHCITVHYLHNHTSNHHNHTHNLVLPQAYLKGFFKLPPALRCDGIQQLVGRSLPILEAHEIVKKIEKLLNQTTSKGVKVKTITEDLEPVIVGE